VFCFNPLDSFKPEFHPIEIVDIYQDVKWYFPKLRPGQMLAVPINDGDIHCVLILLKISVVKAKLWTTVKYGKKGVNDVETLGQGSWAKRRHHGQ
jgi:hypothetical protein